jgi:hypothetical protein
MCKIGLHASERVTPTRPGTSPTITCCDDSVVVGEVSVSMYDIYMSNVSNVGSQA